MYTVSNISAVVELSRVERRARLRARWPQTRAPSLLHQAALAVASAAFLIVRIPDTVGYAASPNGVEGSLASASARLSAASLPSMLVCPGAHRILISGIVSIIF